MTPAQRPDSGVEGVAISNESHAPHITVEEIGGLIEGRFGEIDRAQILAHLRVCDRCLDLYYETVNFRALFGSTPSKEDPHPPLRQPPAVSTFFDPDSPSSIWGSSKTYRLIAGSAIFAALLVVGYLFGSFGRIGGGRLDAAMLAPVRGAVEMATMWGQIVLPGGERLIDGKGSVYRSGFVPIDDELEISLKYLYDEYQGGSASADVAYWLTAGYLSTGQIDAARDVCAGARQTHPDDLRLSTIDAIMAYLDRDYDRSETLLRGALEKNPGDPVIGINLAIVLGNHGDAGDAGEAREILDRIRSEHMGTPFAARADSVIARLNNL